MPSLITRKLSVVTFSNSSELGEPRLYDDRLGAEQKILHGLLWSGKSSRNSKYVVKNRALISCESVSKPTYKKANVKANNKVESLMDLSLTGRFSFSSTPRIYARLPDVGIPQGGGQHISHDLAWGSQLLEVLDTAPPVAL